MRIAMKGLLKGWNKQHTPSSWLAIGVAVVGIVLAVPPNTWGQPTLPDPLVGTWEVPAASPVQTFSGVVLFQGWTCDPAVMEVPAGTVVEIQIGVNPRERAAVGTFRPDTNMSASGPCLGDNNGWGITTNVARFGAGPETISLFVNDTMVEQRMIDIVVLSGAAAPNFFLTDLSGECTIDDFPVAGENTRVEWSQSAQDFAIAASGMGVPSGGGGTCPADMVKVGSVCVDTYEASVWENPDGTGTQYGATADNYPCADTGNDCKDQMYAVSRAGVTPSGFLTWFQAQQACGNVGKRLLSNAEWQMAAAGTPDPGDSPGEEDCKVAGAVEPVSTGSRENCVSAWGTYDMVGNMVEWSADWVPQSLACVPAIFAGTEDQNCLAGASTDAGPGALIRGGGFAGGALAGVFTVSGFNGLTATVYGFRCAR